MGQTKIRGCALLLCLYGCSAFDPSSSSSVSKDSGSPSSVAPNLSFFSSPVCLASTFDPSTGAFAADVGIGGSGDGPVGAVVTVTCDRQDGTRARLNILRSCNKWTLNSSALTCSRTSDTQPTGVGFSYEGSRGAWGDRASRTATFEATMTDPSGNVLARTSATVTCGL